MFQRYLDQRARFAETGHVVGCVGALRQRADLVLHQRLGVGQRDLDVVRIGRDGLFEQRHGLGVLRFGSA